MGPWRRRPETCRCGTRLRCLWGSHVLQTQDPTAAGGGAANSTSLALNQYHGNSRNLLGGYCALTH